MKLQNMSNRDLYDEWTECVEAMARDAEDAYAKRREGQCMDEIVRRMQEASRRPLVRQEA